MNSFREAEENHTPCSEDDECPCYDALVEKDLKPFGKIT